MELKWKARGDTMLSTVKDAHCHHYEIRKAPASADWDYQLFIYGCHYSYGDLGWLKAEAEEHYSNGGKF